MQRVDYLVIGAGVTGLAFANAIREREPGATVLILEGDDTPGGYCKTVHQDGFVWDYSGHFFHFRHPDIESWLRDRMPGQEIRTVVKRSTIAHAGVEIDFPFQKNIHQLPKEAFIDCLYHLYTAAEADIEATPGSFREMALRRFGAGIADRFLLPYNTKLYATDLDRLDAGAMGRFFPDADIDAIVRNMREPDNASYNATFTYPLGGAIEYINALLVDLPDAIIALGERAESIDLDARTVTTPSRTIEFGALISSAPLPAMVAMSGIEADRDAFTWNRVLVYNLGFDRKGREGVHWTYFPDPEVCFYRVGYYDNIMESDRMSLYVEIGLPAVGGDATPLEQVIADLRAAGVVTDQTLVSSHTVTLDPAYVHVTPAGTAEAARVRDALAARGVHSVGRYGAWTYCSIEDNIVEARDLASKLAKK